MRDYAKILCRFWTGDTGRALRPDRDAQIVAIYLFSCGSSNMIGLYYLPLVLLCDETGIPLEGASKALRSLIDHHFCDYCPREQVVWVPEMARIQIDETLKPRDNRIKAIVGEAIKYRKSKFFQQFVQRYGDPFHLSDLLKSPFCSEPLQSPSKGPSEPLRSQEQEQEQEQEQGREANDGTGAPKGEAAPLENPFGPDPRNDDARKAARAAFSHWSDHRPSLGRGYPLDALRNEFAKIDQLVDVVAQETPIVRASGALTGRQLLIPQAVDCLIRRGARFKAIGYAAAAVRSVLEEWAQEGEPSAKPGAAVSRAPSGNGRQAKADRLCDHLDQKLSPKLSPKLSEARP